MDSQEERLVSKLESLNDGLEAVVSALKAIIHHKRNEVRPDQVSPSQTPATLPTHREPDLTNDVDGLPELATKKEVAKWAKCSTRQIELLVNEGSFPVPVKLGSAPRWRRSDLLKWLDEQTGGVE